MISPTAFQDLVSGRRRGFGASALRAALRLAAIPYCGIVRLRNGRYDRGRAPVITAAAPVVSVGNLTVGGAGKTPVVQWIAEWLLQQGVKPAILSRGYRATPGKPNDEALELALALPETMHLQQPDRAASAVRAIESFGAETLLLDDGFQHRRLARDLDVVLLDAAEPFGYGRLLPAGLLREPPDGLRRADVVVLSRADMLDAAGRDAVRRRVAQLAPQAAWCEAVHAPQRLLSAAGERSPLDDVVGRNVAAFCGIGNPAGFRHTLATLGCRVCLFREFPDHCGYDATALQRLGSAVEAAGADFALCTRKDLVKLTTETLGRAPLRAIEVGLQFEQGQAQLEAALLRVVKQVGRRRVTDDGAPE